MLDVSHRRELSLHAEVAADVTSALDTLAIQGIVVGAFARDLHLHYGAGVPLRRGTEDIDFACMVSTWPEFDALRARLIESGACRATQPEQHRFKHRSGITIDLVPFGRVETDTRRIIWPPTGDVVMDAFGLREALASREEALLPGDVRIQIVSLAALALLKLVAWRDRHQRSPRKDATDLALIVGSYLKVDTNSKRLWSEFVDWTEAETFDYELAGARMLGHDLRRLLDNAGISKVVEMLRSQIDPQEIGLLPQQMDRHSPQRARGLLQQLRDGLAA